MMRLATWFLACALWLCAFEARADVTYKGTWPEPGGEHVTLSVSGTRAEAITRLAEAAGWSVVTRDLPPSKLEVEVKDQPAAGVLELLLSDGDYIASRNGSMLSIAPDRAAVSGTPVSAASPPPAGDAEEARDITVTGQNVTIAREQVVQDVTVFGGSVKVLGTVLGDISVFGGSVKLDETARVHGDVSAVGGSISIMPGAHVEGDVNSTGGLVDRSDRSDGHDRADADQPKPRKHAIAASHHDASEHWLERKWDSFLGTLARTALMFAFGTVLLTLLGPRMERLQAAFAERPTRAFALGVVGLVAALLTIAALCITLVGIPVAIIAVLSGVVFIYAGICAVFTSLGAALLRHRNDNPYVHLAVGCALYCVLSTLPVVGNIVTILAILVAIGVLISTRVAGFFPERHSDSTTLTPS